MKHTTADAEAVRHYDRALSKLLTLNNDPAAEAEQALSIDPDYIMAHVLKGPVNVLGTDLSAHREARIALEAAESSPAEPSSREYKHLAALRSWLDGQFPVACSLWEEILVEEPHDALAMFAAHQGDFLLGVTSELRDRVARRLPSIEEGSALKEYYRGMHAFGLEEMGDYARAAEAGSAAVQSDRRDAWAIHAVAHVHEMTNNLDEGERWLKSRIEDWATDNFFAIHNWWHLALYYLDREHWGEVLDLYDQRIRGTDSAVIFDLLDASALLWRLTLHNVEVGDRWQRLAALWDPHIDDAWYAFNDLHAMMSFVGAGRTELARRLVARLRDTASRNPPNGAMTRLVGLPVTEGLLAYGEERYQDAVNLLLPVKARTALAGVFGIQIVIAVRQS